jgi:hypothetical protein
MTEVLKSLNSAAVRYLLIGGQAMRLFGMPRYTMDWDFFVPPRDLPNFDKLNQCLAGELDIDVAPLGPAGEHFVQTYQTRFGVLQFHLGIPGVPKFDVAYESSITRSLDDSTVVKCLSGEHLLAAKRAANRPEDQLDIEYLLELRRVGRL